MNAAGLQGLAAQLPGVVRGGRRSPDEDIRISWGAVIVRLFGGTARG